MKNELVDKKRSRILFPNGDSLITDEDMMGKIFLNDSDPYKVVWSEDAEAYEKKYLHKIILDNNIDVPDYDDQHSDKDLERLVDRVFSSDRLKMRDEEIDRINKELDYFDESNSVKFILSVVKLIDSFKDSCVVWGVGRGSSCASYVLYLLEIHDVDCLKYDIDFKEFSKEGN